MKGDEDVDGLGNVPDPEDEKLEELDAIMKNYHKVGDSQVK